MLATVSGPAEPFEHGPTARIARPREREVDTGGSGGIDLSAGDASSDESSDESFDSD